MGSFWKQSREYVVALAIAVLFALLAYFGIAQVFQKNRATMVSIQEAMVDRKMIEEQTRELSVMREEADRIRSLGKNLDVFVNKEDIISIVESLEALGKELDVSVVSEASASSFLAKPVKKLAKTASADTDDGDTSAKKEEKPDESLVSLLPEERSVFVTFRVTGSYGNVIAFLQKLDTMPKLLDVLSLEITPEEKKEFDSASISVSGALANPFVSSVTPVENTVATPSPANRVTASFNTVLYTAP